MPSIKPISDLRNYTEVLKEVDSCGRVYMTRNGHGVYTIMTMQESDELDRLKAANAVVRELRQAEFKADQEGWISDEEMLETMGLE